MGAEAKPAKGGGKKVVDLVEALKRSLGEAGSRRGRKRGAA